MKPLTTKQEARLLNKKRKLEALANISKLNDSDREAGDSEENQKRANSTEPVEKRSKADASKESETQTSVENSSTSGVISDEDYASLKRELNQKRRELKNVPKLRLKLFGENAALHITPSIRTPVFITDIQHLIMFALFGSSSPCSPSRWCHLEKANKLSHTVVVVLDGLSLYHYSSYETHLESCSKIFDTKVEVVIPDTKSSGQVLNEFITVPLTDIKKQQLIEQYGSLEAALEATKNPALMMSMVFPMTADDDNVTVEQEEAQSDENAVEIIPRTQLLLSALQMVDEGYPLPLRGELANRYKDFVLTKDSYTEVTARSPMFALDCEMCRTAVGVNELTRISIINENHESIYETLVRPQHKIIDYLTPYSGITPEMMTNVTKTLAEVQADVRRILPPDAILVGQSLHSDLVAMRMMHPYVIDTSVIFNISGDRRRKSKLQVLASEFLGESIQKNPLGHDSIEDCLASLKLTKLKLTRGIDFGDVTLINRRRFYEIQTTQPTAVDKGSDNNVATSSNPKDRSTAVVTASEKNGEKYQELIDSRLSIANKTNSTKGDVASPATNTTTGDANNSPKIRLYANSSNKHAVQKTCEIALEHALTLTHLNIPEKYLNEARVEKSFKKLDQWIDNIWKSVAPKGLFIVLFSGNNNSASSGNAASGLALLQTKGS